MNEANEKTEAGNHIKRGFSFTSCMGTEGAIMQKLSDKGYKTLFCDAPYFWNMINFKENKLYGYCEGDTTLITCKNKSMLKKEIESMLNFYADDEEKQEEIKYCLERNKFKLER